MFSRQEAFDLAVRTVVTQGGPARTRDGLCKYRTPEGRKCHVGALIPDDMYNPAMEGSTVTGTLGRFPEVRYYLKELDLTFLATLQKAHDYSEPNDEFWSEYKNQITFVAKFYKLDDTEALKLIDQKIAEVREAQELHRNRFRL